MSRKGWTYPACSWSRAKFDAIIIATGQAGPSLAGRLVDAGMKIAVIERKLFGVTCVNTGRMPTKTLIAGAYAVKIAPRAADFGIRLCGSFRHSESVPHSDGYGSARV